MTKNKQHNLCGDLIIAFANAETTDKAANDYIKNLQKVFNFPISFIEKARNGFPYIEKFKQSMDENRMKLLDLLLTENLVMTEINGTLVVDKLKINTYDAINRCITFHEFQYYPSTNDPADVETQVVDRYEVQMDEVESFLDHIEPPTVKHIIICLNKLIEVGTEIDGMKLFFSADDLLWNRRFVPRYKNLIDEHDHIQFTKERLIGCLDYVIGNREGVFLCPSPVDEFLEDYNEIKGPHVIFTFRDQRVIELPIINENTFYDRRNYHVYIKDFYDKPLSYCLVEFLKCYSLSKKLRHCPFCKHFYIATDAKRTTRCYESECERKYQSDKKRKQRIENPLKYGSIKPPTPPTDVS